MMYNWLNAHQKNYLKEIQKNCHDIYSSSALQTHQETILRSKVFQKHYGFEPQMRVDSYLLIFDRPFMAGQMQEIDKGIPLFHRSFYFKSS